MPDSAQLLEASCRIIHGHKVEEGTGQGCTGAGKGTELLTVPAVHLQGLHPLDPNISH